MNSSVDQRVRKLFDAASSLPPASRTAFLDESCADATDLRREVESLLAAFDGAKSFLETPVTSEASLWNSAGVQFPSSPTNHEPDQIHGYRIVRELGRGGMGVVYEAEQTHPHRLVALKVISHAFRWDEHARRMFQREVQSLARLRHPGIAAIHEAGVSGDQQYFYTMELVQGVPLTEYANRHDLSMADRLRTMQRVCEAIHYAHQRAVIHRDIKPSNILIDATGSPKILDFGLARITDADLALTTMGTEIGRIQGTLNYMSPEQARGRSGEIGVMTDVYALGVVLFELVTGKLPHNLSGILLPEAVRVICEDSPTRPGTLNRTLRGDVEAIALKAIEKDPTRRYQSASDMAQDIERHLANEPILARPPTAIYQLHKLVARHRLPCAFASLVFLLTVVFAGWMSWAYRRADQALEAERVQHEQATFNLARAERAEKKAITEATTADQTTRFLQGMLASITPETARGRDISVIREVLNEADKRIETELSDQPKVAAAIHHTLGTTFLSLGELSQAEEHLQAAINLKQSVSTDTSRTLHALGRLKTAQGAYEEAQQYFSDALEQQHAQFGSKHADIAQTMNDFAWLLIQKGDYAKAKPLLQQALAMRRELLGDNSIHVAQSLNDLGNFMFYAGSYTEAETLMREALQIRQTILGDDHPYVATSLNNLAALMNAKGDDAAAEPLYRRALASRRALLGKAHPDVAGTLNNLAVTLQHLKDYDGAEACFRESLDIFRQVHGEEHPAVATGISNLAILLKIKKDYTGAETLLREALRIRTQLLGRQHPDVAYTLLTLGEALQLGGDAAGAVQPIREALNIRKKALPPDHWLTDHTRSILGSCYASLGRDDEAEALLIDSLTQLGTKRGTQDIYTQGALRRLLRFYESIGHQDEAATYRSLYLEPSEIVDDR